MTMSLTQGANIELLIKRAGQFIKVCKGDICNLIQHCDAPPASHPGHVMFSSISSYFQERLGWMTSEQSFTGLENGTDILNYILEGKRDIWSLLLHTHFI